MAGRPIGLVTEALRDAGWTINEYATSIDIANGSVSDWNREGIPLDRQDHLRRVVGEVWWQRLVDAGLTEKKMARSNNMATLLITEALQDAGWSVNEYAASIGIGGSSVISWNNLGIPIDRQDHLRQVVGNVWWQRFVDAELTDKRNRRRNRMGPKLITEALRDVGWTVSDYAASIGLTSGPISTWNDKGIPLHHQANLRSTVGEEWWQRLVDAGLTDKRRYRRNSAVRTIRGGVGSLRSRSLDDVLKSVRMDVAVYLYRAAKDERVSFRDAVLNSITERDDFADIRRTMHESRLEELKAQSANALHEGRYDEAIRLAQELKELEAEDSGEVTLEQILEMD